MMNTRHIRVTLLLLALTWPSLAADDQYQFLKEHFPDGLFDATGAPTTIDKLQGKAVGIYFSAHWCPACRVFTPSLINYWQTHKKKFEVVFVSSDRSPEAQMDYMAEDRMPWLTMAWRSPAATNLSLRYGVRGIPRLVLLKPNGELFSEFGREFIASGGSIDELHSIPQAAPPLEELVLDSTTASLLRLSRARRWSSLATSFAEIPAAERAARWAELVKALQTQAADPAQGLLLTPGDIVPLMSLLESAPNDEQCAALGSMLQAILKRGFLADYLIAEFAKREAPDQRLAAWNILRQAGLLPEARRFLPSIEESKKNGDWEQVRVWLGVHMDAGDAAERVKAGELITWLATQPADSAAYKALPIGLALAYLSSLETDVARAWLTEHRSNPTLFSTLITEQLAAVSKLQTKPDLDKRKAALELLKLMIDSSDLSVADGLYEHLNLYLHAWLTEANAAITKFHAAVQPRVVNGRRVPGRPNCIKPSILVDMLPRNTAGKVGPELQDLLAIARIRLQLLEGRRAGVLEMLPQLQKSFPDATANFCDEMLKAWSRHARPQPPKNTPNRGRVRNIPMTRAQQVKALSELAQMVATIKARGIAVSDAVVVQAFVACHSRAEVFKSADIAAVFGPPEEMSVPAVSALTSAMLTALQQQWNKPELQAEHLTNREEAEIIAEIEGGYTGLFGVLTTALEAAPGHPDVIRQLANLHMAYSIFQQGQERELSVYTANRDRAFERYSEACNAYETLRESAPETALSVSSYLDWFRAIVGVQQLALPSRPGMPTQISEEERDASQYVSGKQLELLRAQLFSLPPTLRDAHVQLLGQQLTAQFVSNMAPHHKARFGEAARELMHDHPSIERITEHLNLYASLLSEVQLLLTLDGSSNVGSESFGVFVALQHSIALAREGGNFSKYLMNKTAPGMRTRGAQADYRQRFERNIHRALSDAFEVEALTFAEASIQPQPIAREAWSETPMAYLRLKAKDKAVDRVPGIQIDLDFIDSTGQIVLPITSNTLLVNARVDAKPRPVEEIQVEQVLDDRKLSEDGKLRVEIHLSGFGVLPELEPLLKPGPSYTIKSVHREMSDISRLEVADGRVRPLGEAAYRLDLEWTGAPGGERELTFPTLDLEADVSYKRYEDVDIVAASSAVILAGSAPVSNSNLIVIAVLALGLLAFVIWWRQRTDAPVLPLAPQFAIPSNPSALSVLALLGEIRDANLLDASELNRDIQAIEEAHFSPTGGSSQDLAEIAKTWVAKANKASQA